MDRTTYDFMEKLPFFHFISIPDLPRFYYMFNRLPSLELLYTETFR